ncbi:TPA: type II toxin-antitoxin system ParD family antitoxin [Yersinia enterocolitica]|uniref:ribbon-helix-helix domain-containing protein n=1 Tax=Yersinia enterocolitica TaxID=630 RepID=UPI0002DC51DB|nr:type II toxin-antitoxin system ParD family antitoxin [Yersinia enterocolitica]
MRITQQFSITLTHEMAEIVRSRVASDEYASESEVILEGLRILIERDKAIETWLSDTAAPALDAIRKSPTQGRSLEQVHTAVGSRK